mmetsp:Transcript_14709/g.55433  ORF Transcript_14709/g.55433 Transcript_14709/m.55433 type:complete len:236 (-) Transcript_14709:198-905(-)
MKASSLSAISSYGSGERADATAASSVTNSEKDTGVLGVIAITEPTAFISVASSGTAGTAAPRGGRPAETMGSAGHPIAPASCSASEAATGGADPAPRMAVEVAPPTGSSGASSPTSSPRRSRSSAPAIASRTRPANSVWRGSAALTACRSVLLTSSLTRSADTVGGSEGAPIGRRPSQPDAAAALAEPAVPAPPLPRPRALALSCESAAAPPLAESECFPGPALLPLAPAGALPV